MKRNNSIPIIGLAIILIIAMATFISCKAEPEVITETVVETVVETVEVEKEEANPVVVEKWVIPSLIYLTGPYSYYGQEAVFGMEGAQEYINNELGGIRGVPIEIVQYDTGSADVAKTLAESSKIIATEPLILLGPGDSVEMGPALPLFLEEGIYAIPHMSGAHPCAAFKPWALSQVTIEEAQTYEVMNAWYAEMKANGNPMEKVVQFRSPDIPVWTNYGRLQREVLEANGATVVDLDVPIGMANYGSVAVRALGEEPDAMVFSTIPEGISQTLIELNRRGWTDNTKNLFFHSAVSSSLWETGKGFLDGNRTWLFFDAISDASLWQMLRSGYYDKYTIEPSYMMWGCFDEVYLIKQCFEDLQITGDPAKLADERIAIKDWMNNPPNDGWIDTCFGPRRIVNGMRLDPNWLFTIMEDEEKGGILTDSFPCPQTYWESNPYPTLEPTTE